MENNKIIVAYLIFIVIFAVKTAVVTPSVYAQETCYYFRGAYSCSSNYQNEVVRIDTPIGKNEPLSCVPGNWEISTSFCTKPNGSYWGQLKFNECSVGEGGSLWTGCVPGIMPTVTPTLVAATDTPVPTTTSIITLNPSPTEGAAEPTTIQASPTEVQTGGPKPIVIEACSVWRPDGCPSECVSAHPLNDQTPSRSEGNANCDNEIDEQDYQSWREQFLIFQEGRGVPKEERTADFYCIEDDSATQRVDMIDFEIWRLHAYPPLATPRPTPTLEVSVTLTPGLTPTPTMSSTRGDFGNVLHLNGTQSNPEYVYMNTDSFLTNTRELTIEGWFNLEEFNGVRFSGFSILDRARQENENIQFIWDIAVDTNEFGNAEKLRFFRCPNFDFLSCKEGIFGNIDFNRWYHFAVIWKDNFIKGYLDGDLKFTLEEEFITLENMDAYPLLIGEKCGIVSGETGAYLDCDGNMAPFYGKIDEIRISNTARYLDEFSRPTQPFVVDNDTLALWRFDETGGRIAHDSSGNGHHGELIGDGEFIKSN